MNIQMNSHGLIPAVVQDGQSLEVLMVAYMNQEALEKSLETGETHFYSRSRGRLWKKGETSGHIQKITAVYLDCDRDTLLVHVKQEGVACHTGARSCFFNPLEGHFLKVIPSAPQQRERAFDHLYDTLYHRRRHPSKESYTSMLLEGGPDSILKKIAEETGEVILSAKNGERKEIIHETVDLLYHLFVALCYFDIPLSAVEGELIRRSSQSGLSEKNARGHKEGGESCG